MKIIFLYSGLHSYFPSLRRIPAVSPALNIIYKVLTLVNRQSYIYIISEVFFSGPDNGSDKSEPVVNEIHET